MHRKSIIRFIALSITNEKDVYNYTFICNYSTGLNKCAQSNLMMLI